ncbi:hypothetical protein [uncultured Cloacibacillus sp.]|uniref:hypothetical protein n=1 Tax=uncultured Cloacibacillus sp. TaxID=889794 RepID=UPI0027D99A53|nr:hypothetical protein [uncultured Cloacibacillus sp.]
MDLTEKDIYDTFKALNITPDKYPAYSDPVSFGWQFQDKSTFNSTYSSGTTAPLNKGTKERVC